MSEHISQTRAIIAYLRQGYGITSLEAFYLFNCLNLKGRINDLRRIGWGIRTTIITTTSGKRVARYTLTDTQQEMPEAQPPLLLPDAPVAPEPEQAAMFADSAPP